MFSYNIQCAYNNLFKLATPLQTLLNDYELHQRYYIYYVYFISCSKRKNFVHIAFGEQSGQN